MDVEEIDEAAAGLPAELNEEPTEQYEVEWASFEPAGLFSHFIFFSLSS
jgi:hypothetical protein